MEPKIYASKPQWETAVSKYAAVKKIAPNRYVALKEDGGITKADSGVVKSYGPIVGKVISIFFKISTVKELTEKIQKEALGAIQERLAQPIKSDELASIQKAFKANFVDKDLEKRIESTQKLLSDLSEKAASITQQLNSLEQESNSIKMLTLIDTALSFVENPGLDPQAKEQIRNLAQEKLILGLKKFPAGIEDSENLLKFVDRNWEHFDIEFRYQILKLAGGVLSNGSLNEVISCGSNFGNALEVIESYEKLSVQLESLCKRSKKPILFEAFTGPFPETKGLFLKITETRALQEIKEIEARLKIVDQEVTQKEKMLEEQLQSALKSPSLRQMEESLKTAEQLSQNKILALENAESLLRESISIAMLLEAPMAKKPEGFQELLGMINLNKLGISNIQNVDQLRKELTKVIKKQKLIIEKIQNPKSANLQVGLKAGIAHFTSDKATPARTSQTLVTSLEPLQKEKATLENQKKALEIILDELNAYSHPKEISQGLSLAVKQYVTTTIPRESLQEIQAAKPQPIALEEELEEKLQQALSPSIVRQAERPPPKVGQEPIFEHPWSLKENASFQEARAKLSQASNDLVDLAITYYATPEINRVEYEKLLQKISTNKGLIENKEGEVFKKLLTLIDLTLANDAAWVRENSAPNNINETAGAIIEHKRLFQLLSKLAPRDQFGNFSTRLFILGTTFTTEHGWKEDLAENLRKQIFTDKGFFL